MIDFDIKKRNTDKILFTAKIDCELDAPNDLKMRLAVMQAIENRADIKDADLGHLKDAYCLGAYFKSVQQ